MTQEETIKMQMKGAALDAGLISLFFLLNGAASIVGGNALAGGLFIAISFINALNAKIRYGLYKSLKVSPDESK
jgi:hypothetical protein